MKRIVLYGQKTIKSHVSVRSIKNSFDQTLIRSNIHSVIFCPKEVISLFWQAINQILTVSKNNQCVDMFHNPKFGLGVVFLHREFS